jgi:hypothetical protein
MRKRNRFLIAALALATALTASAEGAGGILAGIVKPAWNPSFLPEALMPFDLEYVGGFGYGLTRDGGIVGGFGMAILDSSLLGSEPSSDMQLAGGIGGMVVGRRLLASRGLHLDLMGRLGLGGIALREGVDWGGYAVFFVEPYLDLGIGLTPWMRLSANVGYQMIGNFAPGKLAEELLLRTPSLGFTITWGEY